jgi:hypothetical protein
MARKAHPRERVKNELALVRQRGITFPSYNPLPVRKDEANQEILNQMKKKEEKRKRGKRKSFSVWEYRKNLTT